MSTKIFRERSEFFDSAQAAALSLLDSEVFRAPKHPYIKTLRSMIDYAVMGVVDIHNGLLHTERVPFEECVVIAPLVDEDVKATNKDDSLTIAHSLSRSYDTDTSVQANPVELNSYSGMCEYDNEFLNPVVWLPPWLKDRPRINVGLTVIHEVDHAYWFLKKRKIVKGQKLTQYEELAAMEISAYRLEQQLYFAHERDMYEEQYRKVSEKLAKWDFAVPYKPRNTDKLVKAATAVAIANVIIDMNGGEIGLKPTRRLVRTMKAQELI